MNHKQLAEQYLFEILAAFGVEEDVLEADERSAILKHFETYLDGLGYTIARACLKSVIETLKQPIHAALRETTTEPLEWRRRVGKYLADLATPQQDQQFPTEDAIGFDPRTPKLQDIYDDRSTTDRRTQVLVAFGLGQYYVDRNKEGVAEGKRHPLVRWLRRGWRALRKRFRRNRR